LSAYSSELKNVQQTADLLDVIATGRWARDHNNDRYYNTLRNVGAVIGNRQQPELTTLGAAIVDLRNAGGRDALSDEEKRSIERLIVNAAIDALIAGNAGTIGPVVAAIRNVQQLYESLNTEDYNAIVADDELAWLMQAANIEGTEIPRFFRIPDADRAHVRDELGRLFARNFDPSGEPPNFREYATAAGRIQRDVRSRVQDFLAEYAAARMDRGDAMPTVTKEMTLAQRVTSMTRFSMLRAEQAPAFVRPAQLIVSGCPGSGKSHWINEQLLAAGASVYRVQFHEELGYAEFVGSYKPRVIYEHSATPLFDAAGDPAPSRRPLIDYGFVAGPFALAIAEAYAQPDKAVVVVIEEINRGNAAAAFGELFQTLDRSPEGYSKYPIAPPNDLKLYLAAAGAMTDEGFRLPPNLSIWASMNGADQGVQPLDTAFRRRWSYRYMGFMQACEYASEQRRVRYGGVDVDWDSLRAAINQKLLALSIHEDKLVGPYFLSVEELRDPHEVLTKLMLYLWEDVVRFDRSELFHVNSFAAVAAEWSDGSGAPLLLSGVLASVAEPRQPPDGTELTVGVPPTMGVAAAGEPEAQPAVDAPVVVVPNTP